MRALSRAVPYLAVVTAAALLLAGCPRPPTDHVVIGGDSLTIQTGAAGHLNGLDVVAGLGWQAEHVHHGMGAQTGLDTWVTDPMLSPRTLVIALGQNDAPSGGPWNADGWTAQDAQQMTDLANAVHPDACVAWVLPWYTGTAPGHRDGINAYRAWVRTTAAGRGDPVVDWKPLAEADPSLVDPADGVHLTPAGRPVYAQLLRSAADACA